MAFTDIQLDKSDIIYRTTHFTRDSQWIFPTYLLNAQHGIVPYDHAVHTHDFYEAFIILGGSATHIIGDTSFAIGRGDVFVIKGNTAHGFKDTKRLEIINLMYSPALFSDEWNQLRTFPGFVPLFIDLLDDEQDKSYPYRMTLNEEELMHASSLTDFIIDQMQTMDFSLRPIVYMSFMALVGYLAKRYNTQVLMPARHRLLDDALLFMCRRFSEPITTADIASSLFVTPRHLERLFQTRFGVTPIQYLTRLRLQQAFYLLLDSDLSIRQIGEHCGYTDPAYFSRVYRTQYGIAPNQTRRYFH